MAQVSLYF